MLDRACARDRRGAPRRLDRARRRTGSSRAASPACVGATLVVNLPGSPGGCRDGFAVLRPALAPRARAARGERGRPRTGRRDATARPFATRGSSPRSSRSSTRVFALPFAYVGAFLAVDGVPSAHDLLWITVAMVGARSLAMALNRLIDAGHRRAQPAHGGARASRGARSAAGRSSLFCARLARALPRRRLPARPDRPLALADPRRRLRRLPVPEARTWLCHLWLGAVDGLAPVGAWAAITGELPWQAWALGGAVAFWVAGFDLLYALFDLEVDRAQGLHSFPARFGVRATSSARALFHVATVALLVARGPRPAGRRRSTGSASPRSRRCSPTSTRSSRPRDLRRLDAAFFTMNGVISVTFFVFVLGTSLCDLGARGPRASASGRSASSRGLDLDARRERRLPARHRPERLGEDDAAPALSPGLLAPTARRARVAVDAARIGFLGHEPLVYRELTALENLDLYGRLYRVPERRERIGMLLERFGLWDARNERVGDVLARDAAAARALPRAPARARAAPPRRAVHRARRGGRRAARRRARRARAASGRSLVATHDPERLAPLATGGSRST